MSFGLLKGATPPIGVDFGVSSLKVLQIMPGDVPSLVASAIVQTPDDLLDKPAERLAFQSGELARMLRSNDFRGRRAVCSVSATLTFVQHLQAQRTEGVPLDVQVSQRLTELTGRDAATFILRHSEVGESIRTGIRRAEVMCIAIPREAVMSHMRVLRSCKLEPVGVHSEHLALVRSIDHINKRAEDAGYATLLVDVGYSSTKIVVTHGREPVMARTLMVGGKHLDAMTAKQESCSLAEARRRRVAYLSLAAADTVQPMAAMASSMQREAAMAGAAHVAGGESGGGVAVMDDRRTGAPAPGLASLDSGSNTPERIAASMEIFREMLADEVSLAIRYHRALFPETPLKRSIFYGGESIQSDMCRFIASELRLNAQVGDPLRALAKAGAIDSNLPGAGRPTPGWAVALGLCVSPTDL